MIGVIKMGVKLAQAKNAHQLAITSEMDNLQRPFVRPGSSAAEMSRLRPRPLRRASFDDSASITSHTSSNSLAAWVDHQRTNLHEFLQAPRPPTRGRALPRIASYQDEAPSPSFSAKIYPKQTLVSARLTGAQLTVPEFRDPRSREEKINIFASRIDDIEGALRMEMGWVALDGARQITTLTAGVASIVSLTFGLLSLAAIPMVPGLGLIVFGGLMVSGVVVGVLAQTFARLLWRRRIGGITPQSAKLAEIKKELLSQGDGKLENLRHGELRQYRRIERIEGRVSGGFFCLIGDALMGLFGWDPRLGDLIRKATKSREAREVAKTQVRGGVASDAGIQSCIAPSEAPPKAAKVKRLARRLTGWVPRRPRPRS